MRRILLSLAFLIALLLGGGVWLLTSQSGLQQSLAWLQAASGNRLHVGSSAGRWLGPLQIEEITWQDGDSRFSLRQLHLEWQSGALWQKRLHISELNAARLEITTPPGDDSPLAAPEALTLPLALDLQSLRIGQLAIDALPPINDLHARLRSDGRTHHLEALTLNVADIHLAGHAELGGDAPLPLAAQLEIEGRLDERPLALAINAHGPLAALQLELVPTRGLSGKAEISLTPFAPLPFSAAQLDLQDIDPASWAQDLPAAQLALHASFRPDGKTGIAGEFSLGNGQPGPADRGKLPIERFSGQLGWRDGALDFPALRLQLPAQGEISGQGRWQGEMDAAGHLALTLAARKVNAQALVSSLQKTSLDGRIEASIGAQKQTLAADLRDQRFTLAATLDHADATLVIRRLVLQASGAGIEASGQLALAGARDFRFAAELKDFNPRAFADLPAARINASAKAQGQLLQAPAIAAEFALRDSHFRQVALAGAGTVRLAWPRVSAANLWLTLGSNRLSARGAFGRLDDQLQIDLAAPQLADLGGEGEIHGSVRLAGTLAAPRLHGELQSARLGWPGVFLARKLQLGAQLSDRDDAPLTIDFSLARLDRPAQSGAAEKVLLKVGGSRRQHDLNFSALLPGGDQVQGSASGSLTSRPEYAWQGQIKGLQLDSSNASRNARLQAPAALRLSGSGWRIDDLQLAGAPLDWQARLSAQADEGHLDFKLKAWGTRLGKLEAQLAAGMAGPWALAAQQPWQGDIQLAAEDLSWLGEFLGEGRHTGGTLAGRLHLAGTPAKPQLRGQLSGRKLLLALADNGLKLEDGELRARIDDDLLTVERLHFASPHRTLPRPLQKSLGDAAPRLQAAGSLDVAGQLRISPQAPSGEARLQVRLERVGVWQLPTQWVSLSGQTELSWQQDRLGGQGALAIDAAYWQLAPSGAPSLSDDVVVRRVEQSAPQHLRPNLALDLSVDFGRNFLFDGAGLNSHLAGQIRITAQGRDLPRAVGSIRTRGGRFAAYGQALEIERGILNFQGLPDNPALDVRAMRRGLAVEAGVEVSGTAQKPRVRLVSEPTLPDAEKLTWLILGHGPENVGSGDASVLFAAAGDLLGNNSGGLVGQLKTQFGIDEFGVHQGQLGGGARSAGSRIVSGGGSESSGVDQQILSVGKRLSKDVTLTYEQSLGTAESIAKLSFVLTRQLTLVGRVGSDNALDIFYGISWGRPPRPAKKADTPDDVSAP